MRQPRDPGSRALVRLLHGEASPAEVRGVVMRLLAACARPGPDPSRARPAARLRLAAYARAVEQAAEAARCRAAELAREAAAIRGFAEQLAAQPPARQLLLLRNSWRGRASLLCSDLLAESSALRDEDPRRRLELAGLAFEAAEGLEEARYGACVIADLRSRSAAELADAWREVGRLDLAAEVMHGAFELLARGSGDPLLKARLYELAAALLRQSGQQELPAALLDRSFRIYRRLGEDDLAGRILLRRAFADGHRAAPGAALELLIEAVGLVDLRRDPELAWATIHHLLWALAELGRYETAAELLADCRRAVVTYTNCLESLRLTWLEGKIAAGLGREVEAEVRLLEAGRGFGRSGYHHEACLALMDLAVLLGSQGRVNEVRVLVEEVFATLNRLQLAREAGSALSLLHQVLEEPGDPSSLLSRVRSALHRLPSPPATRLEASLS
jgi:hypothetical protein